MKILTEKRTDAPGEPWPLEWGDEILSRLSQELANKKEIKEELAHIKKPYAVPEIWRQYLSGNYNAELLLQHCLVHLHIP
jgi:hypothetical protein